MSRPRGILIAATSTLWLSLIALNLDEMRSAGWVATSWGAVAPSAAATLTIIAVLWVRTRHPDDAWEDGHASGVAEGRAALAPTHAQRGGHLGWRPTFVASLALVALMAGAAVLNPGARPATATPLTPTTTPAFVTLPVSVAPEVKPEPVAAPPVQEATVPAVPEPAHAAPPMTPASSLPPAVEAVPAPVAPVAADAPVIPVAAPTVAPLTAAQQTALDASNAAALTAAKAKADADLTAANAAETARVTAANAAAAAWATAHPNG